MRFLITLALCAIAEVHAAEFPAPYNSGNDKDAKPPMTGEEAAKSIKLPPGFKATLFAAEPDVQNPIACAWDSRGRLWVAENYTYAESAKTFDHSLRDRILIFEDTDNDGRHDKRTVFADNLTNLTSIELGYGGVYATAAPHLLFIPDKNGDDKPDGEPEVLLDGFDAWSIRHNFVNGLKWGPDGWLYGRHGIQATSNVGRPGAPDSERVKLNCCIWRFHPARKSFEVVCWGGTNPWGHDWNAEGEGFFINTVIGHLYHIIPGAHYERMYGEDLNPHIYQLLPQTADHYHFDTSKSWTESRDGKANELGGGHAHSGCMIYLGENWPEQYRGKLFTINLHGRRLNVERLERKGSGYTAKHDGDLFQFEDPWFRGVELTYGPDGGVYILDWSDQGECHENDGVHRTSGRIYKITYGEPKMPEIIRAAGMEKWSEELLMETVIFGGEWLSRMARVVLLSRVARLREEGARSAWSDDQFRVDLFINGILQRRFGQKLASSVLLPLQRDLLDPDQSSRLATLEPALSAGHDEDVEWAQLSRFVGKARIRALLAAVPSEIRSITARGTHSTEPPKPFPGLGFPANLTERRLAASLLGRYPLEGRAQGLMALLAIDEDASDPLLAALLWSAAEPLAELMSRSRPSFGRIAFEGKFPLIRRFAARRLALELDRDPRPIDELLGLAELYFDEAKAGDVVHGIMDALRGRGKALAPSHWTAFAAKAERAPSLAPDIRILNAIFGDGQALDEIRDLALDLKTDLPSRRQALETLITSKSPDLRAVCEKLIGSRDLAHIAIRGLATFDDANAAKLAIANWDNVRWEAHATVISDFAARCGGRRKDRAGGDHALSREADCGAERPRDIGPTGESLGRSARLA